MKFYFFIIVISFFVITACDVDKTESGEAPDVDVEVQADPGELPEYDVDWANITVDSRTKTVTVPKVVIVEEEKQVEVPYVNVNMPDKETVERTIMIEAEVTDVMHDLSIAEVYAENDELLVIATLQETDQELKDRKVRISDQLILKVPEDLDVEKYIIGDKPSGEFNNQYAYLGSKNEISDELEEAQKIY